MSLAWKLSLSLALTVGAILGFLFWAEGRSLYVEARLRQDSQLRGSWEALVETCAGEKATVDECAPLVGALAASIEPEAFAEAIVIEPKGTVAFHSDFLHGSEALKGGRLSSPEYITAIQAAEPIRQTNVGTRGLRLYSFPDPSGGILLAAYREKELEASLAWLRERTGKRLAAVVLVGTASGLLAGFALSYMLLGRLGLLVAAAQKAAEGDLSQQVSDAAPDELGVLSRSFNRMTSRLAEIDLLKDHFVAQVSHDLRSPLSAMIGESDVLLGGYQGKLTPGQEESMKRLDSSMRDLAKLIEGVLDVTKLEAGAMKLEIGPCDVVSAVESCVEAHETRAKARKQSVTTHFQPDLPEAKGDARALRRILDNLVGNALKFTPEGGEVSVSVRRGGTKELVVAISDSGPGIPRDLRDLLFKKFSRLPEAGSAPGTGLGLAICRELVEAQSGRIWVEDAEDHGARFLFTLPV